MSQEDVLFELVQGKGGAIGLITLNRPQALNALTHAMCRAIDEKLRYWEQDSNIKAVVVQGAGDKAFCAGGDIRHLYDLGKVGNYAAMQAFFDDEYKLNYLISHYAKPYIAFMDGITMGGGMGLSVHGAFRIGSERLLMAMPETSIGFFPDIGGTYFLPRCPNEMGVYLGLTGEKIEAADALYLALIDYVIPSHHLKDVFKCLLETEFSSNETEKVKTILNSFQVETEASSLYLCRQMIQHCFSQNTVEAIFEELKQGKTDSHEKILKKLKTKSPLSLKITLAALRRGLALNLNQCQKMEAILCSHFMRDHDFYEGVRALLVDKDKQPQWQPVTLDKISKEIVNNYFLPLL